MSIAGIWNWFAGVVVIYGFEECELVQRVVVVSGMRNKPTALKVITQICAGSNTTTYLLNLHPLHQP
jgi:hypothetical protein